MKLQEHLDMWAAIFTIAVSFVALQGVFHLYVSGFFHKVGHVVDYYHEQVTDIEKITRDF